MLSETEALQNLGAAIFVFLINNMQVSPDFDQGTIQFCTQGPKGGVYCSTMKRESICGTQISVPKNIIESDLPPIAF